jgi:hypothetical protein
LIIDGVGGDINSFTGSGFNYYGSIDLVSGAATNIVSNLQQQQLQNLL